MNCNFFVGGFPCCPEGSSWGILCVRERSEGWEVEEWGTIIAIENIHRWRRAKIDNEKKSEKVRCILLHCYRGHWYFMWLCVLLLLNLCHQGQILHLVLLVLLSCICAKFFNFRVMLLLGFNHIHPGCLEICLGDSEWNKSISLFCKTYCLCTLSPCSVLSIRAVIACFRKINSYISIQTRQQNAVLREWTVWTQNTNVSSSLMTSKCTTVQFLSNPHEQFQSFRHICILILLGILTLYPLAMLIHLNLVLTI